jgi:SAM-dependent methyltransferase
VRLRWFSEIAALGAALDAFEPRGRVLELACGTGQWTERLARHADRLTALDAAPEALAMNRSRLDGQEVRFIEADLFTWRPPRERFDVVFFSFWLSHVPPEGFAAFWSLVDDCLAPDGRIFLIDNLRSEAVHRIDPEIPGDHDHSVIRRTADGRQFRVWKVLFTPEEIEAKAADLGFELQARSTGSFFLYASGGRGTRS